MENTNTERLAKKLEQMEKHKNNAKLQYMLYRLKELEIEKENLQRELDNLLSKGNAVDIQDSLGYMLDGNGLGYFQQGINDIEAFREVLTIPSTDYPVDNTMVIPKDVDI